MEVVAEIANDAAISNDTDVALAEKAGEKIRGPLQGAWLANLDLERENLLAAHAWCDIAEDGGELGLRLVYALRPYFFSRGLLGLRHGLTLEALSRPGAAGLGPGLPGRICEPGSVVRLRDGAGCHARLSWPGPVG